MYVILFLRNNILYIFSNEFIFYSAYSRGGTTIPKYMISIWRGRWTIYRSGWTLLWQIWQIKLWWYEAVLDNPLFFTSFFKLKDDAKMLDSPQKKWLLSLLQIQKYFQLNKYYPENMKKKVQRTVDIKMENYVNQQKLWKLSFIHFPIGFLSLLSHLEMFFLIPFYSLREKTLTVRDW